MLIAYPREDAREGGERVASDEHQRARRDGGQPTLFRFAPALVTLALVALLLVPLALGARAIEAHRRISEVLAPAALALEDIALNVAMEAAAVGGVVVAPAAEQGRFLDDYRRAQTAVRRARQALVPLFPSLSERTREEVAGALRALDAWHPRQDELSATPNAPSGRQERSVELQRRLQVALQGLLEAQRALSEESAAQRAELQRLMRLQVVTTMALAVLALLAALATMWRARRAGPLDAALRARAESDALAGARADVLSWVSHDLKNPLAAIQMATKNLRRVIEKSPERAPRVIDSIERSSQRMTRLIRDVADASKIDAGRPLVLDTRAVDLRVLVERACEEAEQLGAGQTRIRCSLPLELPSVRGDRVRLEQALSSLLSNMVRASTGKSVIEVSAAALAGHVQITVRDDGTELSEAHRERLFAPFREASRDATGVGLYVVKGVAEAHGGRAWVETEGGGTRFCFTLAVDEALADDAGAPA